MLTTFGKHTHLATTEMELHPLGHVVGCGEYTTRRTHHGILSGITSQFDKSAYTHKHTHILINMTILTRLDNYIK